MCIDTSQPFTLGGYPSGTFPTWRLTTAANNSGDVAFASQSMSVPGVSQNVITPPAGMSSADFDRAIVNNFNSMGSDQGWYDPLGARKQLATSNSNNTNTSILMRAGVSAGQMRMMGQSLQAANQRPAPGLGVPLTAQTNFQSTLTSLKSALQSLSSILSSRAH
jgi:hypothetical protein